MAKTIVGYFEDLEQARRAEQDLIKSGFRNETTLIGQQVDGMHLTQGTEPESLWERVKAAFGVDDDSELSTYQEATPRGGTLVTVRVSDEQTEQVANILDRYEPVDIDQRAGTWEGDTKSTLTGVGPRSAALSNATTDVTVSLAEEELKVPSGPYSAARFASTPT